MSRQLKELFICEHCKEVFELESDYEKHVLGHDIVFIGLERLEWKAMVLALAQASFEGIKVPEKVMRKFNKMKIGVKTR